MDTSGRTPPEKNERLVQLRQELEAIVRQQDIELTLPLTGEVYRVLMPDDLNRLLDDAADDPEQNLPHWAELWPAGIALADAIHAHPRHVRGTEVLELGCGLGVTATAALLSGARLLVADYSPVSLSLTRYNTLRNTGLEPETIQVNWREPSDEFLARIGAGFPVVLAADVLYETRDIYPLIDLVERIVAPGGLLWLAEPGRGVARRFIEIAYERGWDGLEETAHGPWPDVRDWGVRVRLVRMHRVR